MSHDMMMTSIGTAQMMAAILPDVVRGERVGPGGEAQNGREQPQVDDLQGGADLPRTAGGRRGLRRPALRPGRAAPADLVSGGAEGEGGQNRLHLDLFPTGRDNALPMERRIEIVGAKVAELIRLGASAERRSRHDDPEDPIYAVVMHDSEGNEFCVS
jgi:hypothetical protein